MFQTLYSCYTNYRWLRIICAVGLLICGVFLIILFGGFPPLAWRFLAHVIPTLPTLWAMRGLLIVLPFIGLVLLSLLFFLFWLAWGFTCIKVLWYEWETFRARQRVVREVQQVEQPQPVRNIPLSPQPSTYENGLPDTVYPRMPSSARRYSAPTVPNHSPAPLSASIPARASAQVGGGVQQPLQASVATYQGNMLYTRGVIYDEEDVSYGFDEPEHFSYDFYEEPTHVEDVLEEQPQLRLLVGMNSHIGLVRKNGLNEDTVFGLQDTRVTGADAVPVGLFIVADGMGGHSNGQEASRLAISSVSEVVIPTLLNSRTEERAYEDVLRDGIQRANFAVYQHNQQRFVMGTTITSALISGSTAYVANVGDSRTYHYRAASGLTQITHDHSHVWQLFKQGCIKYEDMYVHPKRNEIYRCLGEHTTAEIDVFQLSLQVDDILLLCSDGLWEMVRNSEIEQIILDNAPYASQMSEKLLEAALRNGGADNVSVVVVCVAREEE